MIIVADSNAMDLTARRSSGLHIRCPAPDQFHLCPVALSEPWHLVLLGKWETMDDSVQMVLFLHLYLTCAVLAQDPEVTCQILPSYQMCQLLFLYSDIPAHHSQTPKMLHMMHSLRSRSSDNMSYHDQVGQHNTPGGSLWLCWKPLETVWKPPI